MQLSFYFGEMLFLLGGVLLVAAPLTDLNVRLLGIVLEFSDYLSFTNNIESIFNLLMQLRLIYLSALSGLLIQSTISTTFILYKWCDPAVDPIQAEITKCSTFYGLVAETNQGTWELIFKTYTPSQTLLTEFGQIFSEILSVLRT